VGGEHGRERREPAQDRQAAAVSPVRDDAEELILDPTARPPERAPQPGGAVAFADEDRPAPDAGELEQIPCDDVVTAAQEPDAERREDDRGRREPVSRERSS
jgi:hypothetical protein